MNKAENKNANADNKTGETQETPKTPNKFKPEVTRTQEPKARNTQQENGEGRRRNTGAKQNR